MKGPVAIASLAGMLIVGVIPAITAQSNTAVDPRKAALAGQLLQATHTADQVLTAIESQVPALRATNPGLPPVFWERFLAQTRLHREEFVATLVSIYARTFEVSELEELLRFYSALPNRDKQFVMIAGLAHAGGLGINRHRMWHVVHAFLTYPPMRSA